LAVNCVIDHGRCNSFGLRARKPNGLGTVGNHQGDFGRIVVGLSRRDERRHVRPTAGNQNGDALADHRQLRRRNATGPAYGGIAASAMAGLSPPAWQCGFARLFPWETAGGARLSIPNLITLARILSVPVMVWAIITGWMLAAFILFLAAGVSDAIDGYLPKRFAMTSELGAYLDPLAPNALLVS